MKTSINPHHPFVRHLADLHTLVMMQLKETVDLGCFKKLRSAVAKTVLTVLQFLGVTPLVLHYLNCNILHSVFVLLLKSLKALGDPE